MTISGGRALLEYHIDINGTIVHYNYFYESGNNNNILVKDYPFKKVKSARNFME